MSFGNTFEQDLLKLLFQNVGIANVGDATGLPGSGSAGSLYLALHSADPGEAGDQQTSELAYGGYARAAVARSAGQWSVTSPSGVGQVSNVNAVSWPQVTSGTGTATWVSVGIAAAGASKIIARYQITSPVGGQPYVINGVPQVNAGALTLTLD